MKDIRTLHVLEQIGSDGRHHRETAPMRPYFSEMALMRERLLVDAAILRALAAEPGFQYLRRITPAEVQMLDDWLRGFSLEDAVAIQNRDIYGFEGKPGINHDVLAGVEHLRSKMVGTSLADVAPKVHLGFTAEDVNNLAFNIMLGRSTRRVLIPRLIHLTDQLAEMAANHYNTPMLGRTHVQPAAGTTAGKELGNFIERLRGVLEQFHNFQFTGMISGDVGTYAKMNVIAPHVDWIGMTNGIIAEFGFVPNPMTTQVEGHDNRVRFFGIFVELINILKKLASDITWYCALGIFKQEAITGVVSSSTMPQKVNPWEAEVAFGRLLQAAFKVMAVQQNLGFDVMQRVLNDHETLRDMGSAIADILVAVEQLIVQVGRLDIDEKACRASLRANPQILVGPYNAALQAVGVEGAHHTLRDLFRGRGRVALRELRATLDGFSLPDGLRSRLERLTPQKYIGLSKAQTREAFARWRITRGLFKPEIQAVLFDFDDTLAHGTHAQTAVRNLHLLRHFNVTLSAEEQFELAFLGFGGTMTFIAQKATEQSGSAVSPKDVLGEINRCYRDYDHLFTVDPEADSMLAALKKQGLLLGIVTDRGPVSTPEYLEAFGLREYFEVVVTQADCAERKPRPEPLLMAARKLGIAPQNCLYVGNHVDDRDAARAAGTALALFGGCGINHNPGTNEFRIQSLSEIPDIVRLLSQ